MVASERPAHLKETDLARTDLGDKQSCPSCGAKFYDLRKRPAVCPKCSTAFDPADEGVRVKRGRSRVSANDAAYEDDEEELEKKAKKSGDDDEDEAEEETAEVDDGAETETLLTDDDEDDAAPAGDDLPEGFSETDEDIEDAGAEDDDSVPMLEDEEEFPEDEIGDLPGGDEDDNER